MGTSLPEPWASDVAGALGLIDTFYGHIAGIEVELRRPGLTTPPCPYP